MVLTAQNIHTKKRAFHAIFIVYSCDMRYNDSNDDIICCDMRYHDSNDDIICCDMRYYKNEDTCFNYINKCKMFAEPCILYTKKTYHLGITAHIRKLCYIQASQVL